MRSIIQRIREKVIALTMFADMTHYTQMKNAGVKGFILKKANKFELQQAINTVFSGGNYFSQEILQKMVFQSVRFPTASNQLTHSEIDILNLICKGFTSHEIAEKLFISAKTVETHRSNIFLKADVHNVAGLIVWAINNNYFEI